MLGNQRHQSSFSKPSKLFHQACTAATTAQQLSCSGGVPGLLLLFCWPPLPVPPSPTSTSLNAGTPSGVCWPGSACKKSRSFSCTSDVFGGYVAARCRSPPEVSINTNEVNTRPLYKEATLLLTSARQGRVRTMLCGCSAVYTTCKNFCFTLLHKQPAHTALRLRKT
jgi:hypothetical protein